MQKDTNLTNYQIFNTVTYHDLPVLITNISGDFYYISSTEFIHEKSVKEESLAPLRLTQNILINSKFIQKGQELEANYGYKRLSINIQSGICRITDSQDPQNDSVLIDVFYVHHLQNIINKIIGSRLII